MLQVALARLKQGHRTIPYPAQEPTLPDRLRGLPVVDSSKCPVGCRDCADACPTNAITLDPLTLPSPPDEGGEGRVRGQGLRLDLGRCLFCTDCTQACPEGAIRYMPEYRLATRTREDL